MNAISLKKKYKEMSNFLAEMLERCFVMVTEKKATWLKKAKDFRSTSFSFFDQCHSIATGSVKGEAWAFAFPMHSVLSQNFCHQTWSNTISSQRGCSVTSIGLI